MDEKEVAYREIGMKRRGACCGLSNLALRVTTIKPPSNDPNEIKNDVLKLIEEVKRVLS